MKKVYFSLLCILMGMSVQAQRKIQTTIEIITPVSDQNVKYETFVAPDYKITNIGPDSLRVGDTIIIHDSRNPEGQFFKRYYQVSVKAGESVILNNITDGAGPLWSVYFDTSYVGVGYPNKLMTLYDADDKLIETPDKRKVYKHPFVENAKYAWFVEIADIIPSKDSGGTILYTSKGMGNSMDTVHLWANQWPLGVIDLFADSKAGIGTFPNPASNQVSFTYKFSGNTTSLVTVNDGWGKLVLQKELDKNLNGTQKIDVDISALPSGVYFLRLDAGDKSYVNKILVQK